MPWQWNTIKLSAKVNVDRQQNIEFENTALDLFFQDSKSLGKELSDYIEKFLPNESDATKLSQTEEVFQKVWNELEESSFTTRLRRLAERFRDSIIDSKDSKKIFSDYLKNCVEGYDLPQVLNSSDLNKVEDWPALLDVIEAIQSSILSQPKYCDTSGLWIHSVRFSNSPLLNDTSLYIIFGLEDNSVSFDHEFICSIKNSLDNLGKGLGTLLKNPDSEFIESSNLVDSLFDKIRKSNSKVRFHDDGLKRWLYAINKLAKEAKHEGDEIRYNVGYGSLAYAQAHLHRFEAAPDELVKFDIPIEKITGYIKGFYSIFGNHKNRGLWFNEIGQYCGVFESLDGDFFKASSGRATRPHHQDTILVAKIDGVGCFDVLHWGGNQIARVKDGEDTDMADGDNKRRTAMSLLEEHVIPQNYKEVANWLVQELVEVLQMKTHGTSFVISFEEDFRERIEWHSTIGAQVKTLIKNFSQLDAPLADWDQLKKYANDWYSASSQQQATDRKNYARPYHLFDALAEYANLDGGLWLKLIHKTKDNNGGLIVRAAQQFIPLVKTGSSAFPLDLQMDPKILEVQEAGKERLPKDETKKVTSLKSLFAAINGKLGKLDPKINKYINALSFLHHSGTKTHSLWGLSLTASEVCLCIVLSQDGNVYIFHDGREFTRLY